eukprot:1441224-Prorocentrum_lima.AAC.1
MTSSLVGSEMCIRDSHCSTSARQSAHWTCAGGTSEETPFIFLPSTSTPPVSYTHLTLPTICSV